VIIYVGLLQDSSSSFRPVQIPTTPFRAPTTSDLPVNTNGPFQGPGYTGTASTSNWPGNSLLHWTHQLTRTARGSYPITGSNITATHRPEYNSQSARSSCEPAVYKYRPLAEIKQCVTRPPLNNIKTTSRELVVALAAEDTPRPGNNYAGLPAWLAAEAR
jgi:hypothetical protein